MRMLQGDCLQLLPNLPDQSADLILTDPPYGNKTAYGTSRKRKIMGDDSPLLGLFAVELCYRILKPDAPLICFMETKHVWLFDSYLRRYSDFKIRDYLVWDKVHFGLGHGFRKQYEMMMVLEKGTKHYNNFGFANILAVPRESNTDEHPHKKPIPLLEKLILHCTEAGGTVLDPFMGSGSVGVAAKRLRRHFVGMELDPTYYETARRRIDSTRSSPLQLSMLL